MSFVTELFRDLWDSLWDTSDPIMACASAVVFLVIVGCMVLMVWMAYCSLDERLGTPVSGNGRVLRHGIERSYTTPVLVGKVVVPIDHPAEFWLEIDVPEHHRTYRQQVTPDEWQSTPNGAFHVWSAKIGRFTGTWYET